MYEMEWKSIKNFSAFEFDFEVTHFTDAMKKLLWWKNSIYHYYCLYQPPKFFVNVYKAVTTYLPNFYI